MVTGCDLKIKPCTIHVYNILTMHMKDLNNQSAETTLISKRIVHCNCSFSKKAPKIETTPTLTIGDDGFPFINSTSGFPLTS